MSFASNMTALKKNLGEFTHVRREFLIEPKLAAQDFCAAKREKKVCYLSVNIRTAGSWENICNHQHSSTFYAERFYLFSLKCNMSLLKVYTQELPYLKSLIKR